MSRQINEAGITLVKSFEGLSLTAYRDPIGIPTIGWGHTKGVKMGQTVTAAEAEALLRQDLGDAEAAVGRLVTVPLGDNQFAALVSFAFNCGVGALQTSTLRTKLNGGDYAAVPGELLRWNKAGGRTLTGLSRRRKAEGALFQTRDGAKGPTPIPAAAGPAAAAAAAVVATAAAAHAAGWSNAAPWAVGAAVLVAIGVFVVSKWRRA